MSVYTNALQVAAQLDGMTARKSVQVQGIVRMYAALGATYTKAYASGRPGPEVDTGDYRRSIESETTRVGVVVYIGRWGTNRPQARRLEFGFVGADRIGRIYNQPPYPHFGPARDRVEREFDDGPPMTDANADPTWVFQFTAAAIGERQQLFMEDRIREFVLGKNPDTDGWLVDLDTGDWKVMGREFDSDGGGVIEGGVYSTAKRYRFQLTPPTS
jgi:hypothetical protein